MKHYAINIVITNADAAWGLGGYLACLAVQRWRRHRHLRPRKGGCLECKIDAVQDDALHL